ncbi:MAG: glycoside hydrolase family protein [Chloroflexi bacterium]|nr:glycoside hydrolase family protein [Chloroflexota bacterium]
MRAQDAVTVADLVRANEGTRLKSYKCTSGMITVGVGHNLNAKGITICESCSDRLYKEDLAKAKNAASFSVENYAALPAARQGVLIDMAFQMGQRGLESFPHMRAAIEAGNWQRAAAELLDSTYARVDSPERAERNAEIMRTGRWPGER